MKLSIGIVGLPNVGKSTLFKVLTKQEVNIANYPFVTIDPNVGVVQVPDERLEKLAALSKSKKTIPAVVEFYDIAGLVKGAYKGEGLGNQFLSHIRETQAIVVVLRVFKDSSIIHVENSVDPMRDLKIINLELALKDLESVGRALDRAESDAKSGKKEAMEDRDTLQKIKTHLETGIPLLSSEILMSLIRANGRIKGLNLLTAKKQLYLLNGSEADVPPALTDEIKRLGADYIVADLATAGAIPELIKKAYLILNLITFFTFNEKETRAWTCREGTLAPQAAGVIHTDFEKNFIRAEVINWRKLLEVGGWSLAKQRGLIRLEGKEYVVQDGDVTVVRHG